LFDYTLIDRKTDNALSIYNPIDRKYDIKDRSTGILMVAGGSTGMLGSATLGSTCLTGAGCVLALGGFVSSADLAAAGVKQTLNGKSYNTIGASVISATTGLSLNQSEFIYGLLGLASVTNAVRSQAKEAVNEGRVLVNKPVANCVNGTTCFVAGTLIETNQGLKPIESFIGGELIWSRSDNDFSYNYQPVVATKVTHNQPIYEIVVDNDLGIRESFLTTEEHPFWVKDVGWQQASVLKEGCILLDRNNNDLYVVSQTLLAKLDTVYNIEVDDYHTYHVGKFGVWVHNSNCCDLVYQNIAKETKYGVISNRKLDENALEMDLTSTTSKQAKQVAQSGDPLGVKTEALFENVVKEQGGKVLSGGKYGNNNGYDHVIVFKDAQGNTNLTMIVDSKQLGRKGIKLDPKAAGGNMQMSGEWDAAVLAKLDKNSEAYKAITAAQKNGTLVKGAAYVDKGTEKLMLVRIDPTTKK
jgi:filamentous hemagglutinin